MRHSRLRRQPPVNAWDAARKRFAEYQIRRILKIVQSMNLKYEGPLSGPRSVSSVRIALRFCAPEALLLGYGR